MPLTKAEVSKAKPLTDEQKADIVEEYLGVHPRYFVYEGIALKVNIWSLEHDGKQFKGFTPHLKELGL